MWIIELSRVGSMPRYEKVVSEESKEQIERRQQRTSSDKFKVVVLFERDKEREMTMEGHRASEELQG